MNDQWDNCYWFKTIYIPTKSAHVTANTRLSIQLMCVCVRRKLRIIPNTIARKEEKEKWLHRKQKPQKRLNEKKFNYNTTQHKYSIIFVLTQQFTHYYWSWLAIGMCWDGLLLWHGGMIHIYTDRVAGIQSHLTKSNHSTSLHSNPIQSNRIVKLNDWMKEIYSEWTYVHKCVQMPRNVYRASEWMCVSNVEPNEIRIKNTHQTKHRLHENNSCIK